MKYLCYKCGGELVFDIQYGQKVGRRDCCPHCDAFIHCCYNCKFYSPGHPNDCREPTSAYVADREEGNFCHFYTIAEREPISRQEEAEAMAKLERVFGGKVKNGDPKEKLHQLFGSPTTAPKTVDDARARLDELFKKK